ncbi:MAG: putative lipid II flippase FtsW [Simkaniaceae bacterium]|nr:putative lipid II flippase FtsW [Simkaniaceae bacterium]
MTRVNFCLIVSVALLCGMGFLMVYNTSSAELIDVRGIAHINQPLIKQLIHGFGGLFVALAMYYFGYEFFLDNSQLIFWATVGLLVLVLIPGIGQEINGARRWFRLAGVSIQPSEMMKFVLPLYAISVFWEGDVSFRDFIKHLVIMAVPILLILIEPDNGTAAICIATLITIFFLTGIRWTYWAVPIAALCLVGGSLALKMDHVTHRLAVYLNPELDLLGKGHQPFQAKIATGSGGLYGRGFGQSLQKFSYLPEARSDYIAAIYAEEFGFVGVVFLMALYCTIAAFGFRIASTSRDVRGFYLATILTFLITFQAFLNLGIVSGLLPSKGTNLPFFSQGGSSLTTNLMILALLCSVSRVRRQKWLVAS